MQSSLFFLHDDISSFPKSKIKEKKYDRSRQKPPHSFLSTTSSGHPVFWSSSKHRNHQKNFLQTRKFLNLLHHFSLPVAQLWHRSIPLRARTDVLSWCLYHVSCLYSKTGSHHHEAWLDFIIRNVKRCHNIRSFHESLSLRALQKMIRLFSVADRIWLTQESVRTKNRDKFLWWSRFGHVPSGALLSASFQAYEQETIKKDELVEIFSRTTSFRSGLMFLLFKNHDDILDIYARQPDISDKDLKWALKTSEERGVHLPGVKALVQKNSLYTGLTSSSEAVKILLLQDEKSRVRKI